MKLLDEYIKYYEIYRKFSNTVEFDIYRKIKQIINRFDPHSYLIDKYHLSDDNKKIFVSYLYSLRDETEEDSMSFPAEWLDKPMDEIENEIVKLKEERKNKIEEVLKKEREMYIKARENQEHEEYERLKAKFGG